MTKINDLPKSLPSRDHEFTIKLVGNLTKHEYSGDFKCKLPNLKTQSLIAKTKAFYNAGFELSLDPVIKNLHHMVAYCKHTLTDAPDWFKNNDYGYDLYDDNILFEVYNKILEFENSWIESVWGKNE